MWPSKLPHAHIEKKAFQGYTYTHLWAIWDTGLRFLCKYYRGSSTSDSYCNEDTKVQRSKYDVKLALEKVVENPHGITSFQFNVK